MPERDVPLINDCYYHVFNRSVDGKILFPQYNYYYRFMSVIAFYISYKGTFSLMFKNISKNTMYDILDSQYAKEKLADLDPKVELQAYCIMPNHYHFLLKQVRDHGISDFIKLIQLSFSMYYNIRNGRRGHVWGSRFKVVPITSDRQLANVSRYIHYNPAKSSKVVDITRSSLHQYAYSSYREYIGLEKKHLCNVDIVMRTGFSKRSYKDYVLSSGS